MQWDYLQCRKLSINPERLWTISVQYYLYCLFFFFNKFQQLMKSRYKRRMNMLPNEYTVFVAICTLLWTHTNENETELNKVVDSI